MTGLNISASSRPPPLGRRRSATRDRLPRWGRLAMPARQRRAGLPGPDRGQRPGSPGGRHCSGPAVRWTRTDFIVCPDVLGGSGRTSGPGSDAGDGRAGRNAFPAVSVRDMVNVQRLLLEQLGVRRLKLVIGGSLGGMQVLEWAGRTWRPGRCRRDRSPPRLASPAWAAASIMSSAERWTPWRHRAGAHDRHAQLPPLGQHRRALRRR
jgi:hypothetical protein